MNRHNQSWRTFRMSRGLRWNKHYPSLQDFPNGKTALIIALGVFALIFLIVAIQYQNESVNSVALAEKRANQLGECTQGKLRLIETSDDGSQSATICKEAEKFPL